MITSRHWKATCVAAIFAAAARANCIIECGPNFHAMQIILLVWLMLFWQRGLILHGLVPDSALSFKCEDSQNTIIDLKQKCDGKTDCLNGQDESVKECDCLPNEFRCNETYCIDMIFRCDTKVDCVNGTDEDECEKYVCPETHFTCTNHYCIHQSAYCDHVNDCKDNSDESKCLYQEVDCLYGEYRCENHECILNGLLCDEIPDCKDGSDEKYCEPFEDYHKSCGDGTYIHKFLWCNNWIECFDDHVDELNCRNCTESEYMCKNSRCIRKSHVCDTICDCAGTCDDEDNCSYKIDITVNGSCMVNKGIECKSSFRCISPEYICDGVNDCLWGITPADEYGCSNDTQIECDEQQFLCSDGRCIPREAVCDFQRDCLDGADEENCSSRRCPIGERLCQNGQCINNSEWCDFHRDCFDNSDETSCEQKYRNCTDLEFTCRNGQCIPKNNICVKGLTTGDCADWSHLRNCRNHICQENQFKCRKSFCIHNSLVNNGLPDCIAATDEEGYPFQCVATEPRCVCIDNNVTCTNLGLQELPTEIEEKIYNFAITGNYFNNSLHSSLFNQFQRQLMILDFSNNSIFYLAPKIFKSLWRLVHLDLRDNHIKHLKNGTFIGLSHLKRLYLHGNCITEIDQYAFNELSSLDRLDLSQQNLWRIQRHTFMGLRSLKYLNLSHNFIEYIEDGAFQGLLQIIQMDISHNRIKIIVKDLFYGLPALQFLTTDEFRFCCAVLHIPKCLPSADEFSSCEDLMSNLVLRACIWVLGLTALLGNALVIIWRIHDKRESKVHSFLITNLALGDFFMGIYLLIIAAVDWYYRDVYNLNEKFWRESNLCKVAGFVSTFSSELSVFTLTVITIDRLVCIIFPFKIKRLDMELARIVMVIVWMIVSLLASIPLYNIEYFRNFYGRSGVCLALHITNENPNGWEYSVFIFLALNCVSFIIISFSYICMFFKAKQTRKAVRTPEMTHDNAMAKRMTSIVLTDFCCWMPIILLGIASLHGTKIPPQVFAWIAVFVLPLNAAINPILYTISTASFIRHARRRARVLRRSFMSSLSTNDTRLSFMMGELRQIKQASTKTTHRSINSKRVKYHQGAV